MGAVVFARGTLIGVVWSPLALCLPSVCSVFTFTLAGKVRDYLDALCEAFLPFTRRVTRKARPCFPCVLSLAVQR